jgi:hypothetical protein
MADSAAEQTISRNKKSPVNNEAFEFRIKMVRMVA